MFKRAQSSYPMQSPKVAAMKQFIDLHHSQTLSPGIKTKIQPYGNDLGLLNFFIDSRHQVSANQNNQLGIQSFEANASQSPQIAHGIQSPLALLPRRHQSSTLLPVQHTLTSLTTSW